MRVSGKKEKSHFVKQLYLVTEDNDVVDTVIREFIRCNIEKSRLSVEGDVTDGALDSIRGSVIVSLGKNSRAGYSHETVGARGGCWF